MPKKIDVRQSTKAPKGAISELKSFIIEFDIVVKKFKKKMPWRISINRSKKLKDAMEYFKEKMKGCREKIFELNENYGKCQNFIKEAEKFNLKKKAFDLWLNKSIRYISKKELEASKKNRPVTDSDVSVTINNSIVKTIEEPPKWPEVYEECFKFLDKFQELDMKYRGLLKESGSIAKSEKQNSQDSELTSSCKEIINLIEEISKTFSTQDGIDSQIKFIEKSEEEIKGFEFENIKHKTELLEIKKFIEENENKCKSIEKSFEPEGGNVKHFETRFKEFIKSAEKLSYKLYVGGVYNLQTLDKEVKENLEILKEITSNSAEFEELLKIKKNENKLSKYLQETKMEAEVKLKSTKEISEDLKTKKGKIEEFSRTLRHTYILHAGTDIKPEWIIEGGKINFKYDEKATTWEKKFYKNLRKTITKNDDTLPSCFEALKNNKIEGQYNYSRIDVTAGYAAMGNMLVKKRQEFKCDGVYKTHLTDSNLLKFLRNSYAKLEWTR